MVMRFQNWWLGLLLGAAPLCCGGETTSDQPASGGSVATSGAGGNGQGGQAGSMTGGTGGIGGVPIIDPSLGGSYWYPTPQCDGALTQSGDCGEQQQSYAYRYDAASSDCLREALTACPGPGAFQYRSSCMLRCSASGLQSDPSCELSQTIANMACATEGMTCSYGTGGCLCALVESLGWCTADPRCATSPPPESPDCQGDTCVVTQPIVLPDTVTCECVDASWYCQYSYNL